MGVAQNVARNAVVPREQSMSKEWTQRPTLLLVDLFEDRYWKLEEAISKPRSGWQLQSRVEGKSSKRGWKNTSTMQRYDEQHEEEVFG